MQRKKKTDVNTRNSGGRAAVSGSGRMHCSDSKSAMRSAKFAEKKIEVKTTKGLVMEEEKGKSAKLAALHRMDKITRPKTGSCFFQRFHSLAHLDAAIPVGFGPSFMRALADPKTRNILMCGTGGGFDFCHSALLVPELKRLGKNVVFLSYSFGLISNVTAETVFSCKPEKGPFVKMVTAESKGPPNYQPEIGYCKSLDAQYPESAPHSMYTCYARDFVILTLSQVYKHIVDKHDIDTLLMIDGGSDSLMRGDEHGLGDPIEGKSFFVFLLLLVLNVHFDRCC